MNRLLFAIVLSISIAACAGSGHDPAILKSIDACRSNDAPGYRRSANVALQRLSQEQLTDSRFAVFSHLYNSQPANGYPIRFMSDGSILGRQFDGHRWSIVDDALQIAPPEFESATLFRFNADCNSLSDLSEGERPMLQIEIAIVR